MAQLQEVTVPDIGDFDDVEVVEVLVQVGDRVEAEQSLITLESEKASMEVPSPIAGTVRELLTSVGDKVRAGSAIAKLEPLAGGESEPTENKEEKAEPKQAQAKPKASEESASDESDESDGSDRSDDAPAPAPSASPRATDPGTRPHASPSVRRLAHSLGVDLGQVAPSGRQGRILAEDVRGFVKRALAGASGGLPPLPDFDPEKFGPVEVVELSKINRLTARNLHRSWLHIPHVTHHDEADITELEEFRRAHAAAAEKEGFKLTFVSFIVRAVAAALLRHPRCNATLLPGGERLALRRYVHIGVAVDTDEGLVVPVVRDADRKSVMAIARELADLSARARARKLGPQEMQGASFTVSSLGGIGGTGFTPIVNWPEVAILGVSRAQRRPVYRGDDLLPRLLLPLSLSYDHRVIDGAEAARFTRLTAELLEDLRRVLLGTPGDKE